MRRCATRGFAINPTQSLLITTSSHHRCPKLVFERKAATSYILPSPNPRHISPFLHLSYTWMFFLRIILEICTCVLEYFTEVRSEGNTGKYQPRRVGFHQCSRSWDKRRFGEARQCAANKLQVWIFSKRLFVIFGTSREAGGDYREEEEVDVLCSPPVKRRSRRIKRKWRRLKMSRLPICQLHTTHYPPVRFSGKG